MKMFDEIVRGEPVFGRWVAPLMTVIHVSGSIGAFNLSNTIQKTPSFLAKQLNLLEKAGLIGQKLVIDAVGKVEYFLTSEGKEYLESVNGSSLRQFRQFNQLLKREF